MIEPAAGTSIGLGYRSRLTHELEGDFDSFTPGGAAFRPARSARSSCPTSSRCRLRQAITPDFRLLGTVEWSNWSRFSELTALSGRTDWRYRHSGRLERRLVLRARWRVRLFTQRCTLRGGVLTRSRRSTRRKSASPPIPDADRFWVNVGLSYKYSEATTIDFAYSHLFVEDADSRASSRRAARSSSPAAWMPPWISSRLACARAGKGSRVHTGHQMKGRVWTRPFAYSDLGACGQSGQRQDGLRNGWLGGRSSRPCARDRWSRARRRLRPWRRRCARRWRACARNGVACSWLSV